MGKNIVIIGATSDIAEATARIWAKEGGNLFLIARNEERLGSLCRDLQVVGAGEVHRELLDVMDFNRYDEILNRIKESFNSIDIVLIAHGSLSDQEECEDDLQKAAEEFTLNATTTISLSLGIAGLLKRQQRGTLAVISSVAGDRGRQSNYVYGAAKGGVSTFLQGLRNRLYHEGVQVVTIKPGPVKTKMTTGMETNFLWSEPSKVASQIVSAITDKKDIVYVPGYWRWIMMGVKAVPERLFKRLRL